MYLRADTDAKLAQCNTKLDQCLLNLGAASATVRRQRLVVASVKLCCKMMQKTLKE